MDDQYPQAIARVLNGEGHKVEAMGFLITDRHVLTCAHVVNTALGLSEESQEQPSREVEVVFSGAESCLQRTGTVMFWRPINRDKAEARYCGA